MLFCWIVSFKKSSNNAQGGQGRGSGSGSVSSDPNAGSGGAASARAGQNGAHSQPPLQGIFLVCCLVECELLVEL